MSTGENRNGSNPQATETKVVTPPTETTQATEPTAATQPTDTTEASAAAMGPTAAPESVATTETDAASSEASRASAGASPVAAKAAESAEARPAPKMIRRVVCSYKLGWLPGDWLQTWRRLDRVFARADLKVKATLAPLEDLPADTDILVVPPDLREVAREAVPPGTPILVTPASAAAGAFADLVSRLEAGTEFTAERLDPAEKGKPKIVSYRGHMLID
jgi:hypothetical protein